MKGDEDNIKKMDNNDHDTLIRIETKLDRALEDVGDLSKRVGILEKGYWKVVGAVGAVVIVGDAVIKWFFK